MTRRWFSGIAVFCCVLGLAGSASAECAWVLWWDMDEMVVSAPSVKRTWGTPRAYKSREACVAAVADKVAWWKQTGKLPEQELVYEPNDTMATRTTWNQRGERFTHHLNCLPDTVDPRGPKAK